MSNIVIVGAQWGDEGKGKIVDLLSEKFDIVARYQGGHNAGHTVEIGTKQFVLQLIPCGLLRPGKKGVIGNGVVLDPAALLKEIDMLEKAGISIAGRLFISNRTHLIFPYHRLLEKASENSNKRESIGTTLRGIGPTYEDKFGRRGIRVGDIFNEENFRRLIDLAVADKQVTLGMLGSNEKLDSRVIADEYVALCGRLKPYVADTSLLLNRWMAAGESVMFEGAQGTMLDVDHGTYPFVTSSSASAGGVCSGLGVGPTRIGGVVGVSKAYTTRVGGGPFPTEDKGAAGEEIRQRGREFGAVTGRPRRCGWFDVPVLRYSATVNGLDSLIVTKLDILDTLDEIPVCTGFVINGSRSEEFPSQVKELAKVQPVYLKLPGWKSNTYGLTRWEDLPKQACGYLEFIREQLGVEIALVSTGPERSQEILLPGTKLDQLLPSKLNH